jgi:hypothetical protein
MAALVARRAAELQFHASLQFVRWIVGPPGWRGAWSSSLDLSVFRGCHRVPGPIAARVRGRVATITGVGRGVTAWQFTSKDTLRVNDTQGQR